MLRALLPTFCLVLSSAAASAPLPQNTLPWGDPQPMPDGMVQYQPTTWTQEIAVTDGYDRITPVPIRKLESKWHQSGGMEGISGWRSQKYKLVPPASKAWVGNISVRNSLGYDQNNRGIIRAYADGTRFDDVLSTDRGVFEHRSRTKVDGRWQSKVIFENKDARPAGYSGLKQSCSSCHDEAGSGGYATGLVPGGDTVLSDELDWSLTKGYKR